MFFVTTVFIQTFAYKKQYGYSKTNFKLERKYAKYVTNMINFRQCKVAFLMQSKTAAEFQLVPQLGFATAALIIGNLKKITVKEKKSRAG